MQRGIFYSLFSPLLFALILIYPTHADAENTYVITTEGNVNIRSGPGLENSILQKADKGQAFLLIKKEEEWSQINLGNGEYGWVANWLLTPSTDTGSQHTTQEQLAISIADHLRVRKMPGTNSEIIGILNKGESVEVIETDNNWVKINTPAGHGWVYQEYLTVLDQPTEKKSKIEANKVEKIIEKKNVVILNNHTNIRKGPDLTYPVIQKANMGDTFQILESENNWYKIRLSGDEMGYVASWIVSLEKAMIKTPQKDQERSLKNKIIVIDPGHGGHDKGTTGFSGVIEKDLTLRTAKLLVGQLQSAGAKPILTRGTDTFLSLPQRVKRAGTEHADVFISIHYDSILDPSVHGVTTYYYHSYQKPLAIEVHSALSNLSTVKSRGIKFGDYHVLRENNQKAVLLELGYLSNPTEEKKVVSDRYQTIVSSAIFEGIKNYFTSANN